MTTGDQYVFLNEDSDPVPFHVCTKFLLCENTQIYLPSTLCGKGSMYRKVWGQAQGILTGEQIGTNELLKKQKTKPTLYFYHFYPTLKTKKGVYILSFLSPFPTIISLIITTQTAFTLEK